MNNDWIEQETRYLCSERRRKEIITDTSIMIRYLIILIPLLFYACTCGAQCKYYDESIYDSSSYGDGYWWTCKYCRTSQWSNKVHWTGHYYCENCGQRAN